MNTMQYNEIPCNTNAIPLDTIQFHAVSYDAIQYNVIICIFDPKIVIFGNWGHTTACRAAEWAPTRKPKVSRVTSGYGDVMIPLSRVRLRPKKVCYMGVA